MREMSIWRRVKGLLAIVLSVAMILEIPGLQGSVKAADGDPDVEIVVNYTGGKFDGGSKLSITITTENATAKPLVVEGYENVDTYTGITLAPNVNTNITLPATGIGGGQWWFTEDDSKYYFYQPRTVIITKTSDAINPLHYELDDETSNALLEDVPTSVTYYPSQTLSIYFDNNGDSTKAYKFSFKDASQTPFDASDSGLYMSSAANMIAINTSVTPLGNYSWAVDASELYGSHALSADSSVEIVSVDGNTTFDASRIPSKAMVTVKKAEGVTSTSNLYLFTTNGEFLDKVTSAGTEYSFQMPNIEGAVSAGFYEEYDATNLSSLVHKLPLMPGKKVIFKTEDNYDFYPAFGAGGQLDSSNSKAGVYHLVSVPSLSDPNQVYFLNRTNVGADFNVVNAFFVEGYRVTANTGTILYSYTGGNGALVNHGTGTFYFSTDTKLNIIYDASSNGDASTTFERWSIPSVDLYTVPRAEASPATVIDARESNLTFYMPAANMAITPTLSQKVEVTFGESVLSTEGTALESVTGAAGGSVKFKVTEPNASGFYVWGFRIVKDETNTSSLALNDALGVQRAVGSDIYTYSVPSGCSKVELTPIFTEKLTLNSALAADTTPHIYNRGSLLLIESPSYAANIYFNNTLLNTVTADGVRSITVPDAPTGSSQWKVGRVELSNGQTDNMIKFTSDYQVESADTTDGGVMIMNSIGKPVTSVYAFPGDVVTVQTPSNARSLSIINTVSGETVDTISFTVDNFDAGTYTFVMPEYPIKIANDISYTVLLDGTSLGAFSAGQEVVFDEPISEDTSLAIYEFMLNAEVNSDIKYDGTNLEKRTFKYTVAASDAVDGVISIASVFAKKYTISEMPDTLEVGTKIVFANATTSSGGIYFYYNADNGYGSHDIEKRYDNKDYSGSQRYDAYTSCEIPTIPGQTDNVSVWKKINLDGQGENDVCYVAAINSTVSLSMKNAKLSGSITKFGEEDLPAGTGSTSGFNGAEVTILLSGLPNNGKYVFSWKDADGNAPTTAPSLVESNDIAGQFTFTMPNQNLTLEIDYEQYYEVTWGSNCLQLENNLFKVGERVTLKPNISEGDGAGGFYMLLSYVEGTESKEDSAKSSFYAISADPATVGFSMPAYDVTVDMLPCYHLELENAIVTNSPKGGVSEGVAYYASNQKIVIRASGPSGQSFVGWEFTKLQGTGTIPAYTPDETVPDQIYFDMVDADYKFTANFATMYTVELDDNITFADGYSNASAAGSTVAIRVNESALTELHQTLDGVVVVKAEDNSVTTVTVTQNQDGTYTFTMPSYNVKVLLNTTQLYKFIINNELNNFAVYDGATQIGGTKYYPAGKTLTARAVGAEGVYYKWTLTNNGTGVSNDIFSPNTTLEYQITIPEADSSFSMAYLYPLTLDATVEFYGCEPEKEEGGLSYFEEGAEISIKAKLSSTKKQIVTMWNISNSVEDYEASEDMSMVDFSMPANAASVGAIIMDVLTLRVTDENGENPTEFDAVSGVDKLFTIRVPSDGRSLSAWLVNGMTISTSSLARGDMENSYLINIEADTTVTPVFAYPISLSEVPELETYPSGKKLFVTDGEGQIQFMDKGQSVYTDSFSEGDFCEIPSVNGASVDWKLDSLSDGVLTFTRVYPTYTVTLDQYTLIGKDGATGTYEEGDIVGIATDVLLGSEQYRMEFAIYLEGEDGSYELDSQTIITPAGDQYYFVMPAKNVKVEVKKLALYSVVAAEDSITLAGDAGGNPLTIKPSEGQAVYIAANYDASQIFGGWYYQQKQADGSYGEAQALETDTYDGMTYFVMPGADIMVSYKVQTYQLADYVVAAAKIGEKIRLGKGVPYKFESGKTWKVSGDVSVYVGGVTFYVSEEAEYVFE